jgi:hypothetical protein
VEVNCYLLQCQLLQLANSLDVKEYEATWRKDGAKVLRQGGKFASGVANSSKEIAKNSIKKIEDLASGLQKQIADASTSTKQNIADLFNSANIKKTIKAYTQELDKAQDGAGKEFDKLTQDSMKLYAENKPKEAIETAKSKITKALAASGIALESIAIAAGFVFGAPIIALGAGGIGLTAIGEAMNIRNFTVESALNVDGVSRGFKAIDENKNIPEILSAFAKGGIDQLSYSQGKTLINIGIWMIIGAFTIFAADEAGKEVQRRIDTLLSPITDPIGTSNNIFSDEV